MTIEVGQALPNITVKAQTPDGPAEVAMSSILDGRTVVVFAVPGAFTPTCTLNHLPGFMENRDAILAKGVDEIVCIAVNDPFVVGAWADQAGGRDKMRFIADWDAAFTKAIGMDIDLSGGGLGVRSKRYSMLVKDGTVTALNVEDSPGKADASGAARMLEILA